jgi:cell division protein FtsB
MFFSSMNLSILLAIIFVFCLIALSRQTIKFLSIRTQIKDLEKNIVALEEKNGQLNNLLAQSNEDFYKEKEARLKFGLQKPDEKVAIIIPEEEKSLQIGKKQFKQINPISWWDYFFR